MIMVLLFNVCAQLKTKEALALVKKVSSDMPLVFMTNAHLTTSLIDALIKCDDVETAEKIFNRLMKKDQQLFGTMMKGIMQ